MQNTAKNLGYFIINGPYVHVNFFKIYMRKFSRFIFCPNLRDNVCTIPLPIATQANLISA